VLLFTLGLLSGGLLLLLRGCEGERGAAPAVGPQSEREAAEGAILAPGESRTVVETPVGEERRRISTAGDRYLRIVDAERGEGIEGIRLRLLIAPSSEGEIERVGDFESDTEGLVRLAGGAALRGRMRAWETSDPAFALQPDRFEAAALGTSPDEALVLTRVALESAPFPGRLVNGETGAPIGGFGVRVRAWSELQDPQWEVVWPRRDFTLESKSRFLGGEWLISAEDGTFDTRRSFPTGTLEFEIQLENEAAKVHRPGSPRQDIAVLVGPLILLDFDPPAGLDVEDFLASVSKDPELVLRCLGMNERPSPFSDEDVSRRGFWWSAAPVQKGVWPWVRGPDFFEEDEPPLFLALVSRDGLHFGMSRLESFERHRHEPLRVELEARACLRITVRWTGEDPPREIELAIAPEGTDLDEVPMLPSLVPSPESGQMPFLYRGLSEGAWRIVARAERFRTADTTVELRNGRTATVGLTLEPRLASGEITGTVRTESGRELWAARASVGLQGTGELSDVSRWTPVSWKDGKGTFRFAELSPGKYRLRLHWSSGHLPVTPAAFEVTAPSSGHVFLIRDDISTEYFDVRITNDVSDLDHGHIASTWRGVNGQSENDGEWIGASGSTDRPHFSAGPYPTGGTITVAISANGHQPAWLDEGSFLPSSIEGHRLATVTLAKGWGARFFVTDEVGDPVPGIVLSLDGVALPRTNEKGIVETTATEKPDVLQVETEGWELIGHHAWGDGWGSLFSDTGAFTSEHGRLDVRLREQ